MQRHATKAKAITTHLNPILLIPPLLKATAKVLNLTPAKTSRDPVAFRRLHQWAFVDVDTDVINQIADSIAIFVLQLSFLPVVSKAILEGPFMEPIG